MSAATDTLAPGCERSSASALTARMWLALARKLQTSSRAPPWPRSSAWFTRLFPCLCSALRRPLVSRLMLASSLLRLASAIFALMASAESGRSSTSIISATAALHRLEVPADAGEHLHLGPEHVDLPAQRLADLRPGLPVDLGD